MKKSTVVGALALLLATGPAAAQGLERASFDQPEPSLEDTSGVHGRPIAAPRNAVELTVGTGYTQGFGSLQRGAPLADVIGPGIGASVGGAYRVSPSWSLGLEAEYQELARGSQLETGAAARGLAGDLFGVYHVSPYRPLDPWVRFGAGYRTLWTVHPSAPNLFTHGFQLARVALGLDLRASQDIALAPLIGADLDVFVWQRPDGGSNATLTDPRLSTYVYAGVQGRFDLGGSREAQGRSLARR